MSRISVISGEVFEVSFDGDNLSTKYFYCYDIKKPLMPHQVQTTIDIPKIPGLIQVDKKFTENRLTIYGYVEASNYTNLVTYLEDLSAFLYSDSDVKLISDKQSDRYWNVQYLDYFIVDERDDYSRINLIFTCNDPFGYDNTPDSDDQTITIVDDTYSVSNNGDYYAWPVITITFNQNQSHIYVANNNITDNRFDISKAFVNTDELEVDCKNKTIKLNGSNSPAGLGDGGECLAEMIMLATGSNTIAVGTNDETINIDINITFSKPYFY